MAQDAQPDSNFGQPASEDLDSNQTHQGNDYGFPWALLLKFAQLFFMYSLKLQVLRCCGPVE